MSSETTEEPGIKITLIKPEVLVDPDLWGLWPVKLMTREEIEKEFPSE